MRVTGVMEDIPQADNRVTVDPGDPSKPLTHYRSHGAYAQAAVDSFADDLAAMFRQLPVEKISVGTPRESEGHILGTARMGSDPTTSVVDGDQMHHKLRNLYVLGGSSFTTGSVANPSLTIAALSLRSGRRLFSSGAP